MVSSGGTTQVVAFRAHANGKYVCADNAGAAALIANRTAVGSWETFDMTTVGSGTVSLKSHANGLYVTAANATTSLIASKSTVGTAETFQLVRNADGSSSLKALSDNQYVCAENAGAAALIANRGAIGGWEEFDLVPA
jgi:hypothetical protein